MLNEAQKRSLATSLRLLEERLHFIELILNNGSYAGIMFNLQIDLDEQQIQQLHNRLKRIRSLIIELKNRFHLKTHEHLLSSLLNSSSSYFWTVLEDERPEKLKRYGQVDSALIQKLNPILNDLIEMIKEL